MKIAPYFACALINIAVCAVIGFTVWYTAQSWPILLLCFCQTYQNPENERIKLQRDQFEYMRQRWEDA